RAGRQPRVAEIADCLALGDAGALNDSAAKTGQVIVRGHVAVGVLDFDPSPVAGIPLSLDDGAVARRVNWRADRSGPIDAGVHAPEMQDGMIAHAERRGHFPLGDWFAHQEFTGRAAVLVVVVDHVVVWR